MYPTPNFAKKLFSSIIFSQEGHFIKNAHLITKMKTILQIHVIFQNLFSDHMNQGSYRQVCVKFKDFSRTSKIFSYCFQGLKTYDKYRFKL